MKTIGSRKTRKTLFAGTALLLALTSCSFHQDAPLVRNTEDLCYSKKDINGQDNDYFVYSHDEILELIDMINNGEIKDEKPFFGILNSPDITENDYIAFGDALVNLDKSEITVEYLLASPEESASIHAKLNSNTEVFNVYYSDMIDKQYAILDHVDIESDNEDVKVTIQSNSDYCNLYIDYNIVTNMPFDTVIIDSEKEKSLDLKN